MNNLEETNSYIEIYNLPGLNQEEIENMNRLIPNKKIELVIKRKKNSKAQKFRSRHIYR